MDPQALHEQFGIQDFPMLDFFVVPYGPQVKLPKSSFIELALAKPQPLATYKTRKEKFAA